MSRFICSYLAVVWSSSFALGETQTARWTVYEKTLESKKDYKQPLWDVRVWVELKSPSGKTHQVEAYWFEANTWKFRFSPGEIGKWTWKTACSDKANQSLHGQTGSFECVAYKGKNPLYQHGAIGLSSNRLHFQHADGTPYFFLSDTAWNGVLRSTAKDWERYLATRKKQRFTAIQFVSTQWRGGRKTLSAPVFRGDKNIGINDEYFKRLDERVAAINEHGMVACPVILWALNDDDPGNALPEKDALRLAEYIVARWGAYQVIWFLSGDCRFTNPSIPRWKRIGKAIFTKHQRLVTLHPSGQNWIADKFADQDWLDFHSYQSGHGDSASSLRWHIAGPIIDYWKQKPHRPIVNLEPNYEAHPAYQSKKPHSPQHVRRAAYWSLMIAPPAGVSYGHNAIWVWNQRPGPAEGHSRLGIVQPWTTGLNAPGAESMKVMRDFFDSGPWTRLRPAQHLLAEQPGKKNPDQFISAAATSDGKWVVAYLPEGGGVKIKGPSLKLPATATWYDPRNGKRHAAGKVGKRIATFAAPSNDDWLLEIQSKR